MHKIYSASRAAHSPAKHYANSGRVVVDNRPIKPAPEADNEGVMRWAVIFTSPRAEDRAVTALIEAGYSAYCPMITTWIRLGRHKRRAHRPLFPRYVFVGIRAAITKGLTSCRDVQRALMDQCGVMSAPWEIVEGISRAQRTGQFDKTRDMLPDGSPKAGALYKGGERVMINFGSASISATVINATDDERVKVLMSLFGRETTATFHVAQIAEAV